MSQDQLHAEISNIAFGCSNTPSQVSAGTNGVVHVRTYSSLSTRTRTTASRRRSVTTAAVDVTLSAATAASMLLPPRGMSGQGMTQPTCSCWQLLWTFFQAWDNLTAVSYLMETSV